MVSNIFLYNTSKTRQSPSEVNTVILKLEYFFSGITFCEVSFCAVLDLLDPQSANSKSPADDKKLPLFSIFSKLSKELHTDLSVLNTVFVEGL